MREEAILGAVQSLSPGKTLELMLHTNSDRVLEMRTGTNALMNFEASMAGLASEIRKYLWIGLLQYPIAGVGLGRRGANRQKGRIEFVASLWYNEGEKIGWEARLWGESNR